MSTSNTFLSTELDYCEKIAKAVSRHEILMKRHIILNNDIKNKIADAYLALAKSFSLKDETAGYKLLKHLVDFSVELICTKVYNNEYQNDSGILSTCPRWVEALDLPCYLMQEVFKQIEISRTPEPGIQLFCYELLNAVRRVMNNCASEIQSTLFVSRETVRCHALSLGLPVENIFTIWKNIYRQSVLKLDYLLGAGDMLGKVKPTLQLTKFDMNVLDLGLLYDSRIKIVNEIAFLENERLYVLILLYKLMVAAKERCNGDVTEEIWIVNEKDGAQTGSNNEIKKSVGNDRNNMDACSNYKYNTRETLKVWALVYVEYTKRGYNGSFVLVQRRWYELKKLTKKLVHPWNKKKTAHILLEAMANKFPYIMTDDFPNWCVLTRNKYIFLESDFSVLSEEWMKMRLDGVNEDIDINEMMKEINDENNVSVEVVKTNLDTIVLDINNDNYSVNVNSNASNHDKNTIVQDVTQETNVTETKSEESLLLKKLKGIDPLCMKTRIIIEDEFDAQRDLKMDETKANSNCQPEIFFDKAFHEEEILKISDDFKNVSLCIEKDFIQPSSKDDLERRPLSGEDDKIINNTDVNGGDTKALAIDKKLMQLPQIILTPIDNFQMWQKLSRNNVINCKRFSTKKLLKKIQIESKQLSKCRPYIPKGKVTAKLDNQNTRHNNQITENKRLTTQDNNLKKRKFLIRHLNLSKTCYKNDKFWNERNIKLLEQCKPMVLSLERVKRVSKKVELSDIDEIRRMNKAILTAEVAPMSQENPSEQTNSNPTLDKKDEDLITATESKIYKINRNINNGISRMLQLLVYRDNQVLLKVKKFRKTKHDQNNTKEVAKRNSVEEWKRQKKHTLKFFNLKPVTKVFYKKKKKIVSKKDEKQLEIEKTKIDDSDDSDDGKLVIDDDITSENEVINDKPLQDRSNSDTSIKNGINETNTGMSLDNGIKETNPDTLKINETNEINQGISINTGLNTVTRGTSVSPELNAINSAIPITNGINETNTGILLDNAVNKTNAETLKINRTNEINRGISIKSGINTVNPGTSINPGINAINPRISLDNGIKESNHDMLKINRTNEINRGISIKSGINTVNPETSINPGINAINPRISLDNAVNKTNPEKVKINRTNEINRGISINNEINTAKPGTSITNGTNVINPMTRVIYMNNVINTPNNGNIYDGTKVINPTVSMHNGINTKTPVIFMKKKINTIKHVTSTNNGINAMNPAKSTCNGKNTINTGKSNNKGINVYKPRILINSRLNDSYPEMPRDNDIDLIIVSSDDDDNLKSNTNYTLKLKDINNSAKQIPVPELVKITSESPQNWSLNANGPTVINRLSKVVHDIKMKKPRVKSYLKYTSLRDPPPLQLIDVTDRNNTLNNSGLLSKNNTKYYIIKFPQDKDGPMPLFPMPIIQSIKSLAPDQNVVMETKKKTITPVIYNDILEKSDESPVILKSLLTSTNIVKKTSLKRSKQASSTKRKQNKGNYVDTSKKMQVESQQSDTEERVLFVDTGSKRKRIKKKIFE